MISRNTVFVVGAGASAPFGFPVGRVLLEMMVAETISHERATHRLLTQMGLGSEALRDFARKLDACYLPSVDVFLEAQPTYARMGKLTIASILIPNENPTRGLGRGPENWIEYLFGRMVAGPRLPTIDELTQNKVSFVTFNYDRVIEQALTRAVAATYDVLPDKAWEAVQHFPIVHVYGQLGPYAPVKGAPGRTFDVSRSRENLEKAIEGLRIIKERDEAPLEEARRAISGAQNLVFLGFGYDSINMSRIGTTIRTTDKVNVFGTAFNLEAGEQALARRLFAEHFRVQKRGAMLPPSEDKLVLHDTTCIGMLRRIADVLV